jgi:hypothetical protein
MKERSKVRYWSNASGEDQETPSGQILLALRLVTRTLETRVGGIGVVVGGGAGVWKAKCSPDFLSVASLLLRVHLYSTPA